MPFHTAEAAAKRVIGSTHFSLKGIIFQHTATPAETAMPSRKPKAM
jgi:hypothetical protein